MKPSFPKICFIILIFQLIFTVNIYSDIFDNNPLKFRNISIEDGLTHSKINDIYQDRFGFIWIATNNGLNKYDGYEIKSYLPNLQEPNSINAYLLRRIIEDEKGNLWIGTEGGGLNQFDPISEKFIHYTNNSDIILPAEDVNDIIKIGNILWLATNRGLVKFDILNRTSRVYRFSKSKNGNNCIWSIYNENNYIWVGTYTNGIFIFDIDKESFIINYSKQNSSRYIPDNDIRTFYLDKDNNFWIGTYNSGLLKFNRYDSSFICFIPDTNYIESRTVRAIWDDGKGNIWIGTRLGIYIFNKTKKRFVKHIKKIQNDPYSLSHNSIQVFLEDMDGNLWIGTRVGISYLNWETQKFINITSNPYSSKSLNNKVVYSILESSDGDLYIGTEEGGLNHFSIKNNRFHYYIPDPNVQNSIKSLNIKSLVEDANGNIWIGFFKDGINIFNPKTKTFTDVIFDSTRITSPEIGDLIYLLRDSENNIWIASSEYGLTIYDWKRKTFCRPGFEKLDNDYLNIKTLYNDRNGNILIGLNTNKFGVFNPKKNSLKTYKLPTKNINIGISPECFHRTEDGYLWIGTSHGGLYKLDTSFSTVKIYTLRDGLPSNTIYGILEDDSSNLWISTDHGLVKFNPKKESIKTYFKEDGLASNQFCYNAYYKTRNGYFLFGTINGLVAFDPNKFHESQHLQNVIIKSYRLGNKKIMIDYRQNSELSSKNQPIVLPYNFSAITFNFVSLNYQNSYKNQYAYMLEGFDKGWNYVGNQKNATYTNLSPGKYTFKVKSSIDGVSWKESNIKLNMVIKPPFWDTIWFKLLIVSIIGFFIYHFYRDQKQKQKILKTQSLANLNQLKLLRNQMNPHFLFNALGSIRSMILIDRKKAWEMITSLSDFLRYTLNVFNKFETSLYEEVEATKNYIHIEEMRFKNNLKVRYNIDTKTLKNRVPAFFLQPIVENAIKYGMETSKLPLEVSINISEENDKLDIKISNTGYIPDKLKLKNLKQDESAINNIIKRLQLLFGDSYSFNIYEDDGWVNVDIKIFYKDFKQKILQLEESEAESVLNNK